MYNLFFLMVIVPKKQPQMKKRKKTYCNTHSSSSTCWTSGERNGDGACSGASTSSSGCAPGCSTGSTRTLPTAGNGASPAAPLGRKTLLSPADMTRLSEQILRVTDALCLSSVTIRGLMGEWLDAEGHDVRPAPGVSDSSCVARNLTYKKPAKSVKELQHAPADGQARCQRRPRREH